MGKPIQNIRHPTENAVMPKLRRVRRLDCIRLDEKDATYFTDEGYLVDHPILTSCGIFEYANPDGSIRRELRLPEHVFAENSLKTYKGKPIIITHEAGEINRENVDREQIGTILTAGYRDGDDVRAEIIIHNTDAMKDCGLKELSLGYNLDLLEEPGVWNGEPYDAVQTNITINHLALVASARAGNQARLNIDGSDEPELKGGRAMEMNRDGKEETITLTPEQIAEAVRAYISSKQEGGGAAVPSEPEDGQTEQDAEPAAPAAEEPPEEGSTPQEIAQKVRERKDTRTTQEEAEADIDMLLACIENLLSSGENTDHADGGCGKTDEGENPEGEENSDSPDDNSRSMNADSADDIIRQRLSICRIGDRLNMDGLENRSILDGKKAIINKVLPNLRLEGKSESYIDAAYDMAVSEASRRKDVNYQRRQMTGKGNGEKRMDGTGNEPAASAARQRMIDREGGTE